MARLLLVAAVTFTLAHPVARAESPTHVDGGTSKTATEPAPPFVEAVGSSTAAATLDARLGEIATRERLSAADARELARVRAVVRTGKSGEPGERKFVEGYVLIQAPLESSWRILSDPKTGMKYSSCLKDVVELARSSDGELERLKLRETHTAMWMSWSYTVYRVNDRARGVISWELDPTAKNDVSELVGSWRLIPVDDRNTVAAIRMSGDLSGGLGALGSWMTKRHIPHGLQEVRQFVEATTRSEGGPVPVMPDREHAHGRT